MTCDILAIGAHPDDVELACGGTVAREAAGGKRVCLLDLTRGEAGTRGSAEIRAREAERAASILGAAERRQLDFGDGGLRVGRAEELELVEEIRRLRPRLVLAPFPEDRHPDHARAGALAASAAFYAGLRGVATSLAPHRPQQVLFYPAFLYQAPSFVVDVSAHHARKMEAIRAFASQFHDPSSREPETVLSAKKFLSDIEARGRHFGMMIGAEFGEGFVTKRPPRLDDPVAAFEGYEPGF